MHAAQYKMTSTHQYCTAGKDITTEAECQIAAAALSKTFAAALKYTLMQNTRTPNHTSMHAFMCVHACRPGVDRTTTLSAFMMPVVAIRSETTQYFSLFVRIRTGVLQHCGGSSFFNSTKPQICLTVQARFERCARPCYSKSVSASC